MVCVWSVLFNLILCPATAQTKVDERPNILWILVDDISPILGAYGDAYAQTPTIDALARRSTVFNYAFSIAPVCSPARSALITGMYPTSIGTNNMRSFSKIPAHITFFTEYLRQANYYTANIGKHDFNMIAPETAWSETVSDINVQDWDRSQYFAETQGQTPFFAIINLFNTHESRIAINAGGDARDLELTGGLAAQPPIPPYYPKTPEIAQVMAQYYKNVSEVDQAVAGILNELEADGLSDSTIIFFFADHGTGVPRSKRSATNSGLQVPFMTYFPPRYAHLAPTARGGRSTEIVSFVDFAPSVLDLAGIPVPDHFQGQSFIGPNASRSVRYAFGFRDRMDERFDMVRIARDDRYQYVRNFMPHLSQGQFIDSMYKFHPLARSWHMELAAGKLDRTQAGFFLKKPVEELYDLKADPFETENLAARPEYQKTIAEMRAATFDWMRNSVDIGLIPESELHALSASDSIYEYSHRERDSILAALETARLASDRSVRNLPHLIDASQSENPFNRYWAAMGFLILDADAIPAATRIRTLLQDENESIRIIAAESLCLIGECANALDVLAVSLRDGEGAAQLLAANAIDRLGAQAMPILPTIRDVSERYQNITFHTSELQKKESADNPDIIRLMYISYIKRVLAKALRDLEYPNPLEP